MISLVSSTFMWNSWKLKHLQGSCSPLNCYVMSYKYPIFILWTPGERLRLSWASSCLICLFMPIIQNEKKFSYCKNCSRNKSIEIYNFRENLPFILVGSTIFCIFAIFGCFLTVTISDLYKKVSKKHTFNFLWPNVYIKAF